MDYEQYTINEAPVEEETKNEIVPVEAEEPEKKKSGNTAAGVAIGALLTIGIFAAAKGVKRIAKRVRTKAAAKKAMEAEIVDDEWEDEFDEPKVVLEETREETKKNK